MSILKGHGLLLKLPYADGGVCRKQRTFLVFDTAKSFILLLNISSIQGKARKLQFESNLIIPNYRPPFLKPSFVKLDALYKINYFPELNKLILHNGDPLRASEINSIESVFLSYKNNNNVKSKHLTVDEVKQLNSNL